MYPKTKHVLALGRQGFRVHPLEPNTKDPHENAYGFAARDALSERGVKKIEWWWRQRNYNIGIATGPGGRFIVIDVDVKKGKAGKRGKTGGGMNLRFTGGHESDSFWECCRPPTSMAYRMPI
jgi:hypothetical protein